MNLNNKENIKVIVRVRPRLGKEVDSQSNIKVEGNKINVLNSNKSFSYDYVASEDIDQNELFMNSAYEIAESALNGFNGTIFVYGQTGAGKTYTLMGKNSDNDEILIGEKSGILPRTIDFLFNKINNDYKGNLITVKCSFLEIYNENLYDLLGNSSSLTSDLHSASFSYGNNLNSSILNNVGLNNGFVNQNNQSKSLFIRDQGESVKVENLSLHAIANTQVALDLIQQGKLSKMN